MGRANGADIATMRATRPGNTMTRPEPEDRLWEAFKAGITPSPQAPGDFRVEGNPNFKFPEWAEERVNPVRPGWDFGQQPFNARSDRERRAEVFGEDLAIMAPVAAGFAAGGGVGSGLMALLGGMGGGQMAQRAREVGSGEAGALVADALTDTAMTTVLGGPGAGAATLGKQGVKALAKKSARFIDIVPDLRKIPDQSRAWAIAKTDVHLKKVGKGGYTGAPPGVRGPKSLEKMRDKFYSYVKRGQAVGSDWYERMGRTVSKIAPGRETQYSVENALFSPQAPPEHNFGFQLQAHNAYESGLPRKLVKTTDQATKFNNFRDTGETGLSLKTEPYHQAVDPTHPGTVTGTHDVHDLRAWGYETDAPSANQHRFMDYETVRMVERANVDKLGGKSDWNADSIQASAWVSKRAESEIAQGMHGGDFDTAMRAATVNDFTGKHGANATYESIPNATGGHLEGIADQPFDVKAAFTDDVAWTDPGTGQDVLYDAAGRYQEQTKDGVGAFYNPDRGITEFNPNRIARPMVAFDPIAKGKRAGVAEVDKATLDAVETYRAYVDNQWAGAWNKGINVGKQRVRAGDANAINLVTGQLDEKQVSALHKLASEMGFNTDDAFAIQNQDSMLLMDFGQGKKNTAVMRERIKTLNKKLGEMGINAKIERQYVDSNLLDFGNKTNPGARTDVLLEKLNDPRIPALFDRMDTPEIRKRLLGLIDRDIKWASRPGMGKLSEELQRARQILADGGLKALDAARKAGTVLPVVALPVLGNALDTEQRQRGD